MTRQETIQQKTTQQEPIRQELPQPNGEAPRANLRLAIDGMHCANCAANIEKHYRATPGVVDVAVNLANNTGRVVFDPAQASVDDMLAVFDDLSFTAEIIPEDAPLVDEKRRAREAARAKRDRKVFGAAAVLTVIIVAIGMSLGGLTGYALNPARDLGPRIAHAILPIKGKGSSNFKYGLIVPIFGPIIGGIVAVLLYNVIPW